MIQAVGISERKPDSFKFDSARMFGLPGISAVNV
jgi:hypothetical protein